MTKTADVPQAGLAAPPVGGALSASVRKLPEARGYVWTYLTRGIGQTFILFFLGPGLVDVCTAHPPTWLNLDCTTIPIMMVLLGALLLVALTPVVGMACEYTGRRKNICRGLHLGFCATFVVLTAFGPKSWQYVVFVAMAHTAIVELAHTAVNAYLPELSPHVEDRVLLSASGLFFYVAGAIAYGGLLLAVTAYVPGMGSATASVRVSAIIGAVVVTPIVLWSQSLLGPRPAGKHVDFGRNLFVAAWRKAYEELSRVWRDYRDAGRYLRARSFFFGGQRQLPFTTAIYIKVVVGVNPQLTVLTAFVVGGIGALIGGLTGRLKLDPKKVVLTSVVTLALGNAIMPWVYHEHSQRNLGIVYGVLWGLSIGVTNSVERAMFACIVPACEESVFFGLYHFTNSVLEWLPALIYIIIQSITGSVRYAPLGISAMMLTGAFLTVMIDIAGMKERADAEWGSRRISKALSEHTSVNEAPDQTAACEEAERGPTGPGAAGTEDDGCSAAGAGDFKEFGCDDVPAGAAAKKTDAVVVVAPPV